MAPKPRSEPALVIKVLSAGSAELPITLIMIDREEEPGPDTFISRKVRTMHPPFVSLELWHVEEMRQEMEEIAYAAFLLGREFEEAMRAGKKVKYDPIKVHRGAKSASLTRLRPR